MDAKKGANAANAASACQKVSPDWPVSEASQQIGQRSSFILQSFQNIDKCWLSNLLMGFWWDFKEIMQFWTWIFHILMRDPTDEKLPISPCVAGRIPAWRAMSSRSHRRALPQCLQRQSRTGKKSKAGFWRFSGDVFCISICNELSLSIIYNVYNYI